MTSQRVQREATYEDVLAAPAHRVAEIVNGTLITSPRPAPRHSRASSTLGIKIGGAFDLGSGGPGGWWILDEPELHLGRDVMVPDLAGWRRDRLPRLPEESHFSLSPDWVCEVLSDSSRRHDRAVKMPLYASHGVAHLWLVDPVAHTLEAFSLEGHRWVLVGSYVDEDVVRATPFESLELALAPLWDIGSEPPASASEGP